ncbi:MAG: hypothetical protein HKM95_00945 [Inquilinus sp.]|nr:hypothetical protein [Inquilinus sp.]
MQQILALAAVIAIAASVAGGTAAAQEARFSLGEDQFAAGGDIRLVGPAGGDLIAAGGNLDIAAGGAVDLIAAGGTITVDGPLREDAILAGGTVTLAGTVAQDVIASGGRLRLMRGARIGDDALLSGGSVTLDGDIGGGIDYVAGRGRGGRSGWEPSRGAHWGGALFGALGTIAAGAVAFLLLPGLTLGAAAAVRERPVFSLLLGIAVMAGVPLLAILLFATVIGIPLGAIALLLYPALLFLAIVATAFGLSEGLLRRRLSPPTPLRRLGTFALAVVVLYILFAIPWIGGLLGIVALLVGLGALGQSLAGARRDSLAAG